MKGRANVTTGSGPPTSTRSSTGTKPPSRLVDITTLIARDEGWLTDEQVRSLGVPTLAELAEAEAKNDTDVKCMQCGRAFREEDRRASMSGSVMGGECIQSYFLCPDCDGLKRKGPTLADAVALAARVHRNQSDKAGQPYILHPLRVMLTQGYEAAQMVAVLHDVLEDCPPDRTVTPADLRRDGYSEEIIAALEALTKQESEKDDYDGFIERVAKNPLARRVKLADLQDNMDYRRLAFLTDDDAKRMKKYHKAWRQLMSGNT